MRKNCIAEGDCENGAYIAHLERKNAKMAAALGMIAIGVDDPKKTALDGLTTVFRDETLEEIKAMWFKP